MRFIDNLGNNFSVFGKMPTIIKYGLLNMGRGSSKKRDTKKDDLTEAQIKRRDRKKAKRQVVLSKKGIKPSAENQPVEELATPSSEHSTDNNNNSEKSDKSIYSIEPVKETTENNKPNENLDSA